MDLSSSTLSSNKLSSNPNSNVSGQTFIQPPPSESDSSAPNVNDHEDFVLGPKGLKPSSSTDLPPSSAPTPCPPEPNSPSFFSSIGSTIHNFFNPLNVSFRMQLDETFTDPHNNEQPLVNSRSLLSNFSWFSKKYGHLSPPYCITLQSYHAKAVDLFIRFLNNPPQWEALLSEITSASVCSESFRTVYEIFKLSSIYTPIDAQNNKSGDAYLKKLRESSLRDLEAAIKVNDFNGLSKFGNDLLNSFKYPYAEPISRNYEESIFKIIMWNWDNFDSKAKDTHVIELHHKLIRYSKTQEFGWYGRIKGQFEDHIRDNLKKIHVPYGSDLGFFAIFLQRNDLQISEFELTQTILNWKVFSSEPRYERWEALLKPIHRRLFYLESILRVIRFESLNDDEINKVCDLLAEKTGADLAAIQSKITEFKNMHSLGDGAFEPRPKRSEYKLPDHFLKHLIGVRIRQG